MGPGPQGTDDTVGPRHFFVRVAQDGIVQLKRFGKRLVRLGVVATGSEVGDVELAELGATRTE